MFMFIPPFDTILLKYSPCRALAGTFALSLGFKLKIMGQLDEKYPIVGQIPDMEVTNITSRDQIINPESMLDTPNTVFGSDEYEASLEALRNVQSQQEAAYEEWYNSPEQQVIRLREAGINPDLSSLENSGSASGVTPRDSNPSASLVGQSDTIISSVGLSAQFLNSVTTGLSNVASSSLSFASLPAAKKQTELLNTQMGLLGSQVEHYRLTNEGQRLANISSLYDMLVPEIGDLLGSAMQSHLDSGSLLPFDESAWFNDESNFLPLTKAFGSFEGYNEALALARRQTLRARARAQGLQVESGTYLKGVGDIWSDPRLSSDQRLTILQLTPFTQANIALESLMTRLSTITTENDIKYQEGLDVEAAVSAANARSEYDSEFYSSLDAEVASEFENIMREAQTIAFELEKQINQGYLNEFNLNPSESWKVQYLYSTKGGRSWQEAYYMNVADNITDVIVTDEKLKEYLARNERLKPWLDVAKMVLDARKNGGQGLSGIIASVKALMSAFGK